MLRIIRAATLAATLLVALAGAAHAAQPNNQACFGKDLSGYAIAGGGLHYLPTLVQRPGPWGQVVQLHQAGLVPDEPPGIPNSCND